MAGEQLDIRVIAAAFIAFSLCMLAGLAYPRGDFVLVVGRPGMDEAGMMSVIADAGGTFVSSGNLGWLAVAHAQQPGFAGRLMRAGAILVLDHALAEGCLERK